MNGIGLLDPRLSGAPIQIQPAIPNSSYQPGGVLTPGYYSNVAFQLAGSPRYGPYPTVAPPPAPAGGYGIPGSTGAAGGAAGSVLGAIAQNPNLLKSITNTVSGLLGPSVDSPDYSAWLDTQTGNAANALPVTPIPAPSSGDVASVIGAPANGDLYAGAEGAADADTGLLGAATPTDSTAPPSVATTPSLTGGGLLGDAQNALGIYSGLASGTPVGDASAALSAAKLGAATGVLPSAAGTVAGDVAPILSIYSGLQSGTPAGDAQAGVGAVQAASQGANALGSSIAPALGGLAAGLGAFGAAYGFGQLMDNVVDPTKPSQYFVNSLQGMQNLPPGMLQQIQNAYAQYGEAGFPAWWAANMSSAYPGNSPGPVGPNRTRVNQT